MPGRRWGQHFLSDNAAARRIVDALAIERSGAVLEIGPGRGALTQFIVGRAARVIAVEIDKTLANGLQGRWKIVDIVQEDFLRWVLPELPERSLPVVSNLPYNAAGAIVDRLLGWRAVSQLVVMTQKEVALRMAAQPGGRDFGVLSLSVQGRAIPELLFDVPPGAFRPPPEVVSSVIRLVPKAEPAWRDEAAFFRVARAAFSQRRKTLENALSRGLDLPKPEVAAVAAAAGVSPGARPETLSLDVFLRLAEGLSPGK